MPPGNSKVHIIGGTWRGRSLPVPECEGLRPTKGAVRETLFNWLAPHLSGARCVDLFAGTGALGLEAASRGAASVTLIETDRVACRALSASIGVLNATQVNLVHTTAERYIAQASEGLSGGVDIVFFDPPFELGRAVTVLSDAMNSPMLSAGAVVYIERDRRQGLPGLPMGWRYHRQKQMGQVDYALATKVVVEK